MVGKRIARAQAMYGSLADPCVVLAGGDYNMAHGTWQEDAEVHRHTYGEACAQGEELSKMMAGLGMRSANGRFGPCEATRWDTKADRPGREIDYIFYSIVGCERVSGFGMEPFDSDFSDHRLMHIAIHDGGCAASDASTAAPVRTAPRANTQPRQERWEDPHVCRATLQEANNLFGDMKAGDLPLNQERWEATAVALCAHVTDKASTTPGATVSVSRRGKLVQITRHNTVWWHTLNPDGFRTERADSREASKIAYGAFTEAGQARAQLAAARERARVGTELRDRGRVGGAEPAYLDRLRNMTPPVAPSPPDTDSAYGDDLVHQLWVCRYSDGSSESVGWEECLARMTLEVPTPEEPRAEREASEAASAAAESARQSARDKAANLRAKRTTAEMAFVTERVLRILSYQSCHGGLMSGIKAICGESVRSPHPTKMRNKKSNELVHGEAAVAQAFGPDHLATIAALPPANEETKAELDKAHKFAAESRQCTSEADWVSLLDRWDMPPMDKEWYTWINRPFTKAEVAHSMGAARWNTAYGDDGVPTNLMIILAACDPCVELMTAWMQRIHEGEDMPAQWKRQMIKMLHKPGGSKLLPDSYRGITLLAGVLKMFEGLYTLRLYQMTYARQLIHHSQGGFMRFHACTDLHQQWFIMLELAGEVAAVDGDQWKCYPTVNADVEALRLAQKGVVGLVHKAVQRLNEGRVSFVVVGKSQSADFAQVHGSSEGARRAPLLFALLADASAREMERCCMGVRTLGKLEAMLRWADDDRYFASGPRASADLQRALLVIGCDMVRRNQFNSAAKTVSHNNVSSTSVTSARARASRKYPLKTLVMYCLRGGQERASALNAKKEWETPDVAADEKFPLKKPHYKISNLVDERAAGYMDADGMPTVPATRLQQVKSQKWLGILTSADGLLVDNTKKALAKGRTLRGQIGSLVIVHGMMPFSAMATCAQALFVGRVLHAGIVWCNIGMPRDRTHTPPAGTAISSIEGCHLDFACAITGLNRLAGAAMIRNEVGWSPPWLLVCRALCMEWYRVRNFEDTRVLKGFLIILVTRLVKRLSTWMLRNVEATADDIARFTGSSDNYKSMTLDNPGGDDHVVDPRDLVSARRYIWAAHMIFGRSGHTMLMAGQNGNNWFGPEELWTEAVNTAYTVCCWRVHKDDMYDAGFTARTGRMDDKAPMSRRNLQAGATLGLPFIVRVANRHLSWSQSIALALVRMVKTGTIMTNRKQAVINTKRRAGNAARRGRTDPDRATPARAQSSESHRCAHGCGLDDATRGETTEHMVFKCASVQQYIRPFLEAVRGARGMPHGIVQGLCNTDTSTAAETQAMDAFLCLVNGGLGHQRVPVGAMYHVIPALFAMLIGVFRAHPYYAMRKYTPPFADRLAASIGASIEPGQHVEVRIAASAEAAAGGSSSRAAPSESSDSQAEPADGAERTAD